jgi:addiction module HigA family antidote
MSTRKTEVRRRPATAPAKRRTAARLRRTRMHPGRVLEREYIRPHGLNPNSVARACCVAAPRVYAICQGRHGISAEIATRLARLFEVEPRLWLDMQAEYDLHQVERRSGRRIRREIKPLRSGERSTCET